MLVLIVGSSGTVGSAAAAALIDRGHEVVEAHRASSSLAVDITDPGSIGRMLSLASERGPLDAVICAAGATPFAPWEQMKRDDLLSGLVAKFLGQVEVVRQAVATFPSLVSATVTTGVLGREPVRAGSAAAAANGALEAWVAATAGEMRTRFRINAVSPGVLRSSAAKYSQAMPGYRPVANEDVGACFVRSVESMETGRIYIP